MTCWCDITGMKFESMEELNAFRSANKEMIRDLVEDVISSLDPIADSALIEYLNAFVDSI